ncbi:MAG: cation-transporting P-type ATPase [Myxococcota bacterium]
MLWFLGATGGLYALLGQQAEAVTLLVALIPLLVMDGVLHRRTQASIEGLRGRLVARATVMRDGQWSERASEALVPGDRVRVHAGEAFPADGLILSGSDLQVDESALTGESAPVRKRAFSARPDRPDVSTSALVDLHHWGQAGTRLLTGEAELRVLLTGAETLYGEIVRSSRAGLHARTPLQRAITDLVRLLVVGAVALCAALAAVRLQQGFGWADALVSALTLAVAALPEEFPVLLAVFLGVGVHRLARRKALVRRAASVENIGRVTCICSDKTGTITRGELVLTHRLAAPSSSPSRLLACAGMASRTESGDPLDEAILRAQDAERAGLPADARARARLAAPPVRSTPLDPDARCAPSPPDRSDGVERLATFPFTEDRRRETALLRLPDATMIAVTKGAPELILSLCALEPSAVRDWEDRVAEWARAGHKVIACASQTLGPDARPENEPASELVFEGLLAFEDPVRAGVADAVAQCVEAGIQVVMVTGDHRATAEAVAREIGLGGDAPRTVSGEALAPLLDRDDEDALARLDLVVRALPAQKLALVKALQAKGRIVAVTGDGVNDVPALQAADVGIAMSERASRSAREAAAIVLLDDCFATIVAAIAEGRQLFWNLELAFRYLLLIHVPLVLSAALIPLLGYPLLFQPVHIVWLELVIHPSALLAFQALPAPGRLAATRPRPGPGLFPPRATLALLAIGSSLALVVSIGFLNSIDTGDPVEHARSRAMATLCLTSAGIVAALSGLRTVAARWITVATLGSSLLLIQTPALAERLHGTPLHPRDWSLAALVGAFAAALGRIGARSGTPGSRPDRVAA